MRLRLMIVLAAIVLGAGSPAPGAQRPPAGPVPPPILVSLTDDVHVMQNANNTGAEIGQNGGNVTIYVTGDGVILFDARNERMHDDIMAKVRSITDQPIRYVILTHNHADHTRGAARFQEEGATVISSLGTREHMVRAGLPGSAQVVYTEYAEVVLGGKQVQLREYRGHTTGDTVVVLPAARVVVAGDLLASGGISNIVNYADGGNWTDLGRTLDAVATLDFDHIVGGHGPAITKADFLEFRDRVAAIRERVRALNRENRSAEEIGETLLEEFNWGGPGPFAANILGMQQELR